MKNKILKKLLLIISVGALVSCSGGGKGGVSGHIYTVKAFNYDELIPHSHLINSNLYYSIIQGTTSVYLINGITASGTLENPTFDTFVTPFNNEVEKGTVDYDTDRIMLTARDNEPGDYKAYNGWLAIPNGNLTNNSYVWEKTVITHDFSRVSRYSGFKELGDNKHTVIAISGAMNSQRYSDLYFSTLIPSKESTSEIVEFNTGRFYGDCVVNESVARSRDYITAIKPISYIESNIPSYHVVTGTAQGQLCIYSILGSAVESGNWTNVTKLIKNYTPDSSISVLDTFDSGSHINLYWTTLDGRIWEYSQDDGKLAGDAKQLNDFSYANAPFSTAISPHSLFVDPYSNDLYVGTNNIKGQNSRVYILENGSTVWRSVELPGSGSDGYGVDSISLANNHHSVMVSTEGGHVYFITKK